MTDENDVPPSVGGQPPRVRRRAPTIELKATEVAVEEPLAASEPAAPTKESAPEAETGQASTFHSESPRYEDMGPPPEPPSQPPPQASRAPIPGGGASQLVAAALAGALAALLLFAVLWLGGMFSPAENRTAAADPRVSAMETQLRDLAARPAPAAASPKALDDLAARVVKLEAAPPPPAADAGATAAIKGLQTRIDDNAAATREARGRADAAMLAADAARAANERNNVEAIEKRLAALEQTTQKLSGDVAKTLAAAGDRPLRAAVAAQALRASVERGDPFAAELAAAKATAADPQVLTPLEPFASSGLPSGAALARQLSDLAPAMLKATTAPAPAGGFLDRLQANAERLVRVRPIDEAPGDDPAAVISRAQAKASRSDFSGALSELNALPANVRAPAEDWIKRVEARNAALNASRRLVSDALTGLGKSP